jgi:hypothetical protein
MQHESSFQATDDLGNAHTLHVFGSKIYAGHLQDPSATVNGMKQIRTADGGTVNRLEKGRYQVALTGKILHSTAPGAP